MIAASQKAFRDAWRERTRSAFVVAAIAAGVAALLALLGTYAILTREINREYLATHPASAVLHTDGVDQHMLATVLADSEVGAAEGRRMVLGRMKTGPAQWRNLALFVISNYGDIRLNKFVPEQGAWPPATGEVLIERDAMQVARARIGDTVTLRIADGPPRTLRVSGLVHDAGLAQARMENSVYGYITLDTLAAIGEKPSFDLLLIRVANEELNQDHIRGVEARVKRRLEAEGHPVDSIEFPVPGKHPHADLMQGLLLAISSFGIFLLALSAVLALNFIGALMAGQVRQIGVMKALGATRWQVARIYLLQALLLGGAATLLAVPAGIWGSRLLCGTMAVLLNFDIRSLSIPAWIFLSAAGAGVAVPLAAAAIPVWHAVAVSTSRALSSSGTSSHTFGAGMVDRLLAGIGGGARPVLLAVRNSFRRRLRFVLTCITFTCGGMLFMAALNLRTSMIATFDRLFRAERYDLTLDLGEMYPVDRIDRALGTVPGVLASENWAVSDGWVPRYPGTEQHPHAADGPPSRTEDEPVNRFRVVAMPADSRLFVPVMAQGRSLVPGDRDSIVLNPTMAAQNPQMKVGDTVRLHIGTVEKTFRVAGICREPMRPPPIVYVSFAAFDAIHPGMANQAQIALKDPTKASFELARDQIDPHLEHEGIHVDGSRSKAEFRVAVDQHVLMIYVFLVVASSIVGGVAGLGLMTTMSINMLERRREIGILRVIGAPPGMISAIVIGEAVTVAVIAWCAAVALAFPLGRFLATAIGHLLHSQFDVRIAPIGLLVSLGGSLLVGILASLSAAGSAVRLTIREALGYE